MEAVVLQCLRGCLDAQQAVRAAAEAHLRQGETSPGFASSLVGIARGSGLEVGDLGVRQLAAVLLKQVIKRRWSSDSPKFEEPGLTEQEKQAIMALLPSGLSDPESRMRTAIGMALSEIAQYENGWPALLEQLVNAVLTCDPASAHGERGCVFGGRGGCLSCSLLGSIVRWAHWAS